MSEIFVDLSAPQQSSVGLMLNKLYYQNGKYPHISLLDSHGGYPHNGGDHTFWFRAERNEALAFIDLLIDDFPETQAPLSYLYQDISVKNSPAVTMFTVKSYLHLLMDADNAN